MGSRLLKRIGTKTIDDRRVRQEVERDLVLGILGRGDAGGGQKLRTPRMPLMRL